MASARARLFEVVGDTPDAARRVDGYYLPVCAWVLDRVAASARRPLMLALNGPQGAGKSTLCAALVEAVACEGVRAVAVSIDDFYLTHDAQRALAAAHPANPCMEFRGYPGTHDLALGRAVLEALRDDRGGGVRVPAYDKSAHRGRGDRRPPEAWPVATGPFDLVILEGWMLGFAPVDPRALPDPNLRAPNEALASYVAWHALFDALVHLVMADPACVVRWRVDAERARRAAGAECLSDDEAADYVRRFVPAYEAWVPPMQTAPAVAGPALTVTLGDDRHPTRFERRAASRRP